MAGKNGRALTQYWGALDAAGMAAGINMARSNARRLADDAHALLELDRVASAAALAILSIEESGKPLILRRLALASDASALKSAWQELRRHTAKNSQWVLPGLVQQGGRSLAQLRLAVEGGEHSHILDAVKQIALYADCFGVRGHWSSPENVIDRELARELVTVADLMAREATVSLREIELWIEHVKPHNGGPLMGKAVLAFQAALHAEGLTETSAEELAAFMGGLAAAG